MLALHLCIVSAAVLAPMPRKSASFRDFPKLKLPLIIKGNEDSYLRGWSYTLARHETLRQDLQRRINEFSSQQTNYIAILTDGEIESQNVSDFKNWGNVRLVIPTLVCWDIKKWFMGKTKPEYFSEYQTLISYNNCGNSSEGKIPKNNFLQNGKVTSYLFSENESSNNPADRELTIESQISSAGDAQNPFSDLQNLDCNQGFEQIKETVKFLYWFQTSGCRDHNGRVQKALSSIFPQISPINSDDYFENKTILLQFFMIQMHLQDRIKNFISPGKQLVLIKDGIKTNTTNVDQNTKFFIEYDKCSDLSMDLAYKKKMWADYFLLHEQKNCSTTLEVLERHFIFKNDMNIDNRVLAISYVGDFIEKKINECNFGLYENVCKLEFKKGVLVIRVLKNVKEKIPQFFNYLQSRSLKVFHVPSEEILHFSDDGVCTLIRKFVSKFTFLSSGMEISDRVCKTKGSIVTVQRVDWSHDIAALKKQVFSLQRNFKTHLIARSSLIQTLGFMQTSTPEKFYYLANCDGDVTSEKLVCRWDIPVTVHEVLLEKWYYHGSTGYSPETARAMFKKFWALKIDVSKGVFASTHFTHFVKRMILDAKIYPPVGIISQLEKILGDDLKNFYCQFRGKEPYCVVYKPLINIFPFSQ